MISSNTKLLAAALCGALLAACNAIEDVREEPFTPVPTPGVVLQGKVTGPLGKQRSLTLMNNGNGDGAISVAATIGTEFTPFTFGVVTSGSPYNITVKAQPYGKICTVTGGSGTVTTADALDIVVNCVNDPAVTRFFVRVNVPPAFVSAEGALVTLTTEEGVYQKAPAPGATTVQFDDAVFHNVLNGVTYTPVFTWTVSASTTEGSTPTRPLVNKCAMTNATNPSGASPSTNVTTPTVGLCAFTIGSVAAAGPSGVYYSTPPGGTPQTMPAGGLDLQLKDVTGVVVETLTFNPAGGYGASGTAAGNVGTGYTFASAGRSNPSAVYDVAVSRNPTGQTCVVHNGGAATLGVATANITNVHVACRAVPALANQLRGTYEFENGTTYSRNSIFTATNAPNGNADVTTTYLSTNNPDLGGASRGQSIVTVNYPTDMGGVAQPPVTTTNTVPTRNELTFFEDGTFLHGVHGGNQVEHGFYNYNPTTHVINFTLITDTTAGGTNSLLNTGLSGTGGTVSFGGVTHPTMTNVVKGMSGTRGTLSGTFGDPTFVPTTTTPVGTRWSQWVMKEPQNIAGQVTGTFVTQDHRRAWNYNFNTTLGYHTGVNGGAANMQDACFTFEDYRAIVGFYTRRGGSTGCLEGFAGVVPVDFQSPSLANTPGFVGRFPGSGTAFDGRSPSPIYYALGTAATFASVANAAFFPTAETTPAALAWCTTEVFGVRYSLNGNPVAADPAVYFCREMVN